MRKKSKFLTFLLSFVPGLGHIYLGLMQRGMVFLIATAFVFCGSFFLMMLGLFYDPIPFIALPFIWLAALVDSMILAGRINQRVVEAKETGSTGAESCQTMEEEMKAQNDKILALTFAVIPGAGHMYIGLMEKGIKLMVAFFLTMYLSDYLNLSLLLMFAPILWFFSIFDILHKVSEPSKIKKEEQPFSDFFTRNQFAGRTGKYLGMGLIAVGILMIIDKIVLPEMAGMFTVEIREYLKTGIIALLFIAGGFKLIMGSKVKIKNEHPVDEQFSQVAQDQREGRFSQETQEQKGESL